jgi:hypothetical protein
VEVGQIHVEFELPSYYQSLISQTARKPNYLLAQAGGTDHMQPVIIVRRPFTPEPSPKLNRKALKQWSEHLPIDFASAAARDMGESLKSSSLHPTQENQVQYIMTSQEALGWLEKPESGLLRIQAETAPQTQANALSLSSAFLARSLSKSHGDHNTRSPVLYHSCSLRTEEGPRGAETSGTIALVNSLNLQLARHLLRSSHADLASLLGTDKKGRKKAQRGLRPALRLLKRLVHAVSQDESVFIIIDSLSRLSGTSTDAESEADAIGRISRLAVDRPAPGSTNRSGPIVKILMTDLLSEHIRAQAAAVSGDELYVPDRVDVGGHGLNAEYLREVSEASIGRFEARGGRAAGGSSRDAEDSSDEVDSSGRNFVTSGDESN